jgi:prevent-host-death family protein
LHLTGGTGKTGKRERFLPRPFMAIIATKEELMRSVNVAKLKDQLSKYLSFAKEGEEIVIRDRNRPVAKIVPFSPETADEEEALLVAQGRMRLPKERLDLKKFWKMRMPRVSGNKAIEALLADRDEGW